VTYLLTHFLQLSSGLLLEEESAVLCTVRMELLLWELIIICDHFLLIKVYRRKSTAFQQMRVLSGSSYRVVLLILAAGGRQELNLLRLI
jgi:hypothetical protein